MSIPDETSATSSEVTTPSDSQADQANQSQAAPPLAYNYPHATDHPPVAPIPDDGEHEVKSYGGAPEGGT